jgi:hypothetical protein
MLGTILHERGEHAVAEEHVTRSVALMRAADLSISTALALKLLARIQVSRGEIDEGLQSAREALSVLEALGHPAALEIRAWLAEQPIDSWTTAVDGVVAPCE